MCVTLYCVCWSRGQIKPPGERAGGPEEDRGELGRGEEGREEEGEGKGELTQTETDVSKPSYIRCCSSCRAVMYIYNADPH